MKKWIVVALICVFCFHLCACEPDRALYNGDYPELHAVAVNSLLGCYGGRYTDLRVLETDTYGRVMFSFVATVVYEGYGSGEPGSISSDDPSYHYVLAILISQKATSERAYFYDGANYIYCKLPSTEYDLKWTDEDVLSYFTTEQVEELKARNDWNSGETTENCFSVEVVRTKNNPTKPGEMLELRDEMLKYSTPEFYVPLSQDSDGKIVCLLMEHDYLSDEDKEIFGDNYIVMLNSDSELYKESSVHKLSDIWDYTQELYDFKVANDWCFTS